VVDRISHFDPELTVEVAGNEIRVTLPGSSYSVTYFMWPGSSGLVAKDIVSDNDRRFPRMTASQFLRKAWTVANDKARSLGWLV